MAEKIGQGVIYEQPASEAAAHAALDAQIAKLKTRRDDAKWYIVAGIGMLFAGSFSVYFAMGGVVMAVYGGAIYVWMERRIKSLDNPWEDPEIDAWEDEEFGSLR